MRTTPFIVHSIMWLAFLIIGCIQLAKTQLISASGAIGMGVIFYRYCLLHVQQFQWQWLAKPLFCKAHREPEKVRQLPPVPSKSLNSSAKFWDSPQRISA